MKLANFACLLFSLFLSLVFNIIRPLPATRARKKCGKKKDTLPVSSVHGKSGDILSHLPVSGGKSELGAKCAEFHFPGRGNRHELVITIKGGLR
jgi:hypothetical protein